MRNNSDSLRPPPASGHIICVVLILAAGFLLASCGGARPTSKKPPTAHQGVLDLSSWDFSSGGPVELRGEWEFYSGDFVAPGRFDALGSAKRYFDCPGFWKDVKLGNGEYAGARGWATYRLKIFLPGKVQRLGVRIGDVSGASRIFANGVEVARAGRIGTTREEVEPDYRPSYFEIEAKDNLELVIHEASFHDSFGGRLWYAGDIGKAEDIAELRARNIVTDSFVAGLIFIIAALFFVLYVNRRSDATSLYFALMCLGMWFYQVASGEHISFFVFPWLSYSIQFHLRFLVLGSLPGLYVLIFSVVYPEESSKTLTRVIIAISLIFSLTGLLFSMSFLTFILSPFHIYATFVLLYILIILVRALRRGRADALTFILGLSSFIIGTVNDTLVVDFNFPSIFLLPIGQSGFIFFWAVALSRRFARDYQRAEAFGELNRRLRELDEAKTSFFANSSHELRTPITLLVTPLEGILSGRYGETIRRDHPVFGIMKRNTDRLKRLADGLLEFLKVDAGTVTSKPIAVDLGEFLARYAVEFKEVAEKRGIALEARGGAGTVAAADPVLLETCVLNLLSNAVKFTPSGGRVVVSAATEAGRAVLTVEDTGPGIEAASLPKLFERFAASSQKTRTDYSGFGLGLPLTGELVRLMGGSVEVESEPGKGSRFRVSLPRHEGKAEAPREPSRERVESFFPQAAVPAGDGGPASVAARIPILIVDDDRDMTAFLASSLSRGFDPRIASSGAEALGLLEKGYVPRVVICDVMMPGMDGFELKRAVDGLERFSGTPFLFLTAKADPETRLEGLSAGAVDYITKPFRLEELDLKLRSLASMVKADHERLERSIVRILRGAEPVPASSGDWRERAVKYGLEARDFELLALLLDGLGDKEIAARLGLSPRTVSNRVSNVLKQSRATSRTALAAMLLRG